MSVKRILFVCLGNICRSPMAEGVFRTKAKEYELELAFDSCGTGDWHVGEEPDPRAQLCMKKHNDDIGDLRARQFSPKDFDLFDRIYVMDESNLRNVLSLAKNVEDEQKVHMLRNEVNPGMNYSVPDPYFGDGDGFENVYQMLEEAAHKVFTKLKNE